MPCYLFTYHAYLSWMPDRARGYVQRHKGILPPDPDQARQYRANTTQNAITFDHDIQSLILDETHTACDRQRLRLHAVALDPTHAHILVSWHDARVVKRVRSKLKESLTRRLNNERGKRTWFVANASQKRVKDHQHFDHLVLNYLPSHRGLCWRETDPPPNTTAGC